MPGRPSRKAMLEQLDRRTAEHFGEESPTAPRTHLDYVCDWLAGGGTMRALAREIERDAAQPIAPSLLSRHIHVTYGEEADYRLTAARRRGAHAMVDTAVELIDHADPTTREDLYKAKLQGDVRLWVAERWNREQYGKVVAPAVSLTVGALHLDALRVLPPPNVPESVIENVIVPEGKRLTSGVAGDAVATVGL